MRKNTWLLRGEALVLICGEETERFLNTCSDKGLRLWDIRRHDAVSISARVFERDLQLLETIAARCRCELREIEKRGGSDSAELIKRRSRLFLLAMIFALLLTASGLFIWDLEVVGNERLSKGEILRALADCGIEEGTFWPTADAETIRGRMLLRCEDLAWMTLNVRGSRAVVLVLEREEKPEIYSESDGADLVASRGGAVKTVSVRNGRALVGEGEIVTRGQVLVSGEMESPSGETRLVHALGSVTADTWPERTVFLQPGAYGKERQNGFHLILGLRFGKSRVDLVTNSRKELDECDRIVKEYTMGVKGLFRFPLGFVVEVYRPYRALSAAGADIPGAEARAAAALADEIDGEILSLDYEEHGDRIILHAHCNENIALTKEYKNP